MVNKNFFDNHLDALIECVNFASDEIMQIYNSDSFGQEEKSDGSPLTKADKKSNEIILNSLEKIHIIQFYVLFRLLVILFLL